MFWKYTVNLRENTHAEVWFQESQHQVERKQIFSYYTAFRLSSRLSDLRPWSQNNVILSYITVLCFIVILHYCITLLYVIQYYIILGWRTQVRKLRRKKKYNVIATNCVFFRLGVSLFFSLALYIRYDTLWILFIQKKWIFNTYAVGVDNIFYTEIYI